MTPVEQPRLGGERALGADQAVGGDLERALARRRHARRLGRALDALDAEARLRRLEHGRRAHHHAHHHAERRQRVARDPFGKAQRDRRQRRHVRARAVMAFSFFSATGLPPSPTGASQTMPMRRLRPERHQHEAARARPRCRPAQVVVGLVERDRQQHRHARRLPRVAGGLHRALRADFPNAVPRD